MMGEISSAAPHMNCELMLRATRSVGNLPQNGGQVLEMTMIRFSYVQIIKM